MRRPLRAARSVPSPRASSRPRGDCRAWRRGFQKPQLSSSQKFELDDRAFSLTSGIVGNANANLGRPPRPPGFKKRPNTAGAQPMGGLPIEEFLAVMNGGGDSGDLVGKLMQLGISLASNAG